MGTEQRFLVIKTKDSKEIKYFEYDKLSGHCITPKKNVRFEDSINVNRMILINPTLIEKMIEKKANKRFDKLLTLLAYVYEHDEEDGGAGLDLALNEVNKYKQEIINKYRNEMNAEKMEILEKKIDILESELKVRKRYIYLNKYEDFSEDKEKDGKSR